MNHEHADTQKIVDDLKVHAHFYHGRELSSLGDAMQPVTNAPVVTLEYNDLLDSSKDISQDIETAFGVDGLGLLVVRGVPQFSEIRKRALPLAWKFAQLPHDVKQKYEHAPSFFSTGWSHGKEKLDGKPDWRKGSFYANPLFDNPFEDPDFVKQYPSFACPNLWPSEIDGFESTIKEIGHLIIQVGSLLANHIDKFCSIRRSTYPQQRLTEVIKTSRCAKLRLLHYFAPDAPMPDEFKQYQQEANCGEDADFASWCGWHNDQFSQFLLHALSNSPRFSL